MPKIVDHEQYRKELLSKCFDLFAEKGYATITMRQLAQGLGVSTGTLYHYFPSKEALFEQLIYEMTSQDLRNFIAAAQHPASVIEQVEQAFNFIEKHEAYFIKQTLLWVEFYQHQSREQKRTQVFYEVWKEHEQMLMDAIGLQDKVMLNLLGCFIDGLLVHRMFEGDNNSFAEEKQRLIEMLKLYLETTQQESAT
jgi:AcrR family transcriptional regulator